MTEVENREAQAPQAQQEQPRAQERRRASLPQPDFAPYKAKNAYPGQNYFFVGHSYNVVLPDAEQPKMTARVDAIKSMFKPDTQWMSAHEALANEEFSQVLTRFEHDLLHRLPETALIGPAIDEHGQLIEQSFTVWRQERRRQRAFDQESKSVSK